MFFYVCILDVINKQHVLESTSFEYFQFISQIFELRKKRLLIQQNRLVVFKEEFGQDSILV